MLSKDYGEIRIKPAFLAILIAVVFLTWRCI